MAVTISKISKRFGSTIALDQLDLSIRENEMFALLGPNGAGKTTLIHILATLMRPDSGTAEICGIDVVRQPRRARAALGVVFQEPSLDGKLTVEENLDFHARMYRMPAPLRRERIGEMLELVELATLRRRLVRSLSPGMKRRLEIARALVHDSRVLILDEPTVGLDAQSRGRIWEYLARIRARRTVTVVVTTHYIEEVEGCDRVCVIDDGRVLALDRPDTLRSRHGRHVLRVQALDASTAAEIAALHPDAVPDGDGGLAIVGGRTILEDLLRRFGPRIDQVSLERPSLGTVFLGLTGRHLREEGAAQQGAGKR
ncbi:ABC transporter ATP-binding protein [Roseitranquillus sediminis]|uniref:ABC transporter ATP-binding protein n=1 Tax=Roseitranquillus sediminis TaxID=2809051 RepID=UPI001D0CBE20|nr:ABC transporter ATP-binding protein [Roseitranquillus sediminis]MBM9594480.1 ABC transporter ATP-binding protein [Roseitranquillus sediminis]